MTTASDAGCSCRDLARVGLDRCNKVLDRIVRGVFRNDDCIGSKCGNPDIPFTIGLLGIAIDGHGGECKHAIGEHGVSINFSILHIQ
ncbi:hypothetical protein SDC9_100984 [bioreactor metagenome]|uniref:Uncharacterized protein n=1 Tax=bioreactor metagenome TaxID=1076179 RepID=A0A645AM71_9ZZZZ